MSVQNNFGKINGMIEITDQTIAQRDAFSNRISTGNALGANRTASSLFRGIGGSNATSESVQLSIKNSYYNTIGANSNPDFNEDIKPSTFKYPSDFMTSKPDVSDKPNILGPNIETLKFDLIGQPDTSSRTTVTNYEPKSSPTLSVDNTSLVSTKGYGMTVSTNIPGSSTIGDYLARRINNVDGTKLIKKGESIDHDNLNYEG